MNVEIGTEAVLLPEKEYINGTAFAVHVHRSVEEFFKCSFLKDSQKLLKPSALICTKSTVLILRSLKENIHLVTLSLSSAANRFFQSEIFLCLLRFMGRNYICRNMEEQLT